MNFRGPLGDLCRAVVYSIYSGVEAIKSSSLLRVPKH